MVAAVDTMAYARTGGVPWHREGFAVSNDLTPEELAEAAQITWTVSKRPSYTIDQPVYSENAGLLNDPAHNHIVRDDNNTILGVCSPEGWHPFQNVEIMAFYKKFCEAGHMSMETAGSLRDGRDIWALAKYSPGFTLPGGDQIEGYCLMANSHKPGKAFKVLNTPVRVVCHNTLQMALRQTDATGMFKLAHRNEFNPAIFKEVEQVLGLANEQLAAFQQQTEMLASKQVKVADFEKFVAQLLAPELLQEEGNKGFDGKTVELRDQFRNGTHAAKVCEAMELSPGADLKSAKGTWWGAVNAVTYVMDHEARSNVKGGALYNSWFGRNSTHKRKALDLATEYALAA